MRLHTIFFYRINHDIFCMFDLMRRIFVILIRSQTISANSWLCSSVIILNSDPESVQSNNEI